MPSHPQLIRLIEDAASLFNVRQVSAGLAYSSKKNLEAIHDIGAMPYIPFKVNAVPGQPGDRNYDPLWEKYLLYFRLYRERFDSQYHRQSNVESTFSMVKRKMGHNLRSKKHPAQVNEVLPALVWHNIRVLVKTVYTLGIDSIIPSFRHPTLDANGHSEAGEIFGCTPL